MLTTKITAGNGRAKSIYLKASVLILVLATVIIYSLTIFKAPTKHIQAYSVTGPKCGTWQSTADYRLGAHPSHLLSSITILSNTDVWAVGSKEGLFGIRNAPLAMHWNGIEWHEELVPAWSSVHLDKVSAYSSNDIWAVGSEGESHNSFIVHWDGTRWQNVASPSPSQFASTLRSVAAISPKSAWAVGYYMNDQHRQQPLLMHWDGKSWQVDHSFKLSGLAGDLLDIAAISEDNVWAVGYYYLAGEAKPLALMLHWNGLQWSMVSTPNVGEGIYGTAIAALNQNDIWAVGSDGERGSTLHWDGVSWQAVSNPSPAASDNNNLNSVVAIANNDVWATGVKWADKHEALVMHWDGETWQRVATPQVLAEQGFYGLAKGDKQDVWAVGQAYDDKSDSFYALTTHFIGTTCP